MLCNIESSPCTPLTQARALSSTSELPRDDAPNCSVLDLENDDGSLDKNEPLPKLVTDTVADMLEADIDAMYCMISVWEGYRRPLAAVGIHLCTLRKTGTWLMRSEATIAPRPFAYRCAHAKAPGIFLMPRFACAQDDKQRDLVIKLADKGSMEHNIYRYLAECKSLYDSNAVIGVLPPTAIIGSPYRFAFVAMPMWDVTHSPRELETIREVMTFIRCTLSGLAFLHRHRIAHRDIDQSNIVINWYCNNSPSDLCTQRLREHIQSPAVEYALFDFDLSLQMPPDTSLKKCRRPACEAFKGKRSYIPDDVFHGEPHYNPFAFDVACLGNLYLCFFQEAMPIVPLLAPLISKMTTYDIDDRWSAEEAFVFFSNILAGHSPDILDSRVSLLWDSGPIDNPDLYWSRLNPEFQSNWSTHRSPPLSLVARALRWATTTDTGYSIIAPVRRYLQI